MEFQGESIAAAQGLNKWQERLSASDVIHIDGDKVLLLGVMGTPLAGCRGFVWAGTRHPFGCMFPVAEQVSFPVFLSQAERTELYLLIFYRCQTELLPDPG